MKVKIISDLKSSNYTVMHNNGDNLLNNVIKESVHLEINKHEKLYFTVSDLKYYFLIIKGTIRISKLHKNNTKTTFVLLKEYDLLGSLCEIKKDDLSIIYELQALADTHLVQVSTFKLFNIFCQNKILTNKLIFALHKRLIRNSMLIEILAHRSINNRLISFLLYLAFQFGSLSKLGIIINLKLSHKTIAEILCSTRVTITRNLKFLERMQYIKYFKKNMIITNPILLTNLKIHKK